VIIATGIDIVDVRRFWALIEKAGDRFLRRWFTDDELAYCKAKVQPVVHLAARFAAKEACLKTLRAAWDGSIMLRDVSVATGGSGAPSLQLTGRAAEIAVRAGITHLHVSLSHDKDHAVATVIAVGHSPVQAEEH
jgi:holo-[acyl-carrier protein] synthase